MEKLIKVKEVLEDETILSSEVIRIILDMEMENSYVERIINTLKELERKEKKLIDEVRSETEKQMIELIDNTVDTRRLYYEQIWDSFQDNAMEILNKIHKNSDYEICIQYNTDKKYDWRNREINSNYTVGFLLDRTFGNSKKYVYKNPKIEALGKEIINILDEEEKYIYNEGFKDYLINVDAIIDKDLEFY